MTAEVTPHHFTIDETAVFRTWRNGEDGSSLEPRRTAEIIEGKGQLHRYDRHRPRSHSARRKAVLPVWKAPSGIIGLETALGLAVTELVKKGHLTTMQLVEKMCVNPAKLYHFDKGYPNRGRGCRYRDLQ